MFNKMIIQNLTGLVSEMNISELDIDAIELLDRSLDTQIRLLSELDIGSFIILIISACLMYMYIMFIMYRIRKINSYLSYTASGIDVQNISDV